MRIIPPILLCILVGAMVAADYVLPLIPFEEPRLLWAGAAIVILGVCVAGPAMLRFRLARTEFHTFKEPGRLVTDGPYAFSRNPMYVGMVLAGLGAALITATLAGVILAAVYALVVRYRYIAHEEKVMRLKFGAPYEAYCRRVGRWLGRRRSPDRQRTGAASK